ncbi:MAG: hypothetical protein OEY86_03325 [Nitrospira sp.]|nr:hypothetical protein [Nitrospira sp.]
MKTISSPFTFLLKFIIPVWVVGSLIWSIGTDLPTREEKDMEYLGFGILVGTFIIWTVAGLKKVRMDSTHLYISNYLKEIVVPVDDIVDITDYTGLNLAHVIHFRTPTVFGQSIKFFPFGRFLYMSDGPSDLVVKELKERAGLKVSRPRGQ